MKMKEIQKKAINNFKESYLQEIYEAIEQTEMEIAWNKTQEAIDQFGKEKCDETIKNSKDAIKKAKQKLNFLKDYYKLD